MQVAQRQGRRSQRSEPPAIPVLSIFRNQSGSIVAEKFEAVGGSFQSTLESAEAKVLAADTERQGIHRIVFFDTDAVGQPILVLDVHPGSKLMLTQSLRQIGLELFITTPFAVLGKRLKLTAKIQIKTVSSKLRPVFRELVAMNQSPARPVDLMRNISNDTPDRLKRLLELPDNRVPALEHGRFDSGFLTAATRIRVPEFSSSACSGSTNPQKTEFSFIKLPGSDLVFPKTLQLSLKSIDRTGCAGPGDSPGKVIVFIEPTKTIEYVNSQAPEPWHFVQRPAKGISVEKPIADGSLPRAKSILTAKGIPGRPVLEELWNELVDDYQHVILGSRAGHGVSFFPNFDISSSQPEAYGRWVSSYQIIDTNESGNTVEVTSPERQPDKSKIVVRPLSVQLAEHAGDIVLKASLEQIKNIDNRILETLEFKLSQLPPAELDEQLESVKGLQLEVEGSVLTKPEQMRPTVRMGSLDLEFSEKPQAQGVSGNHLLIRPRGETIDVESSYQLEMKKVSPGGQDYAVSEEFTASSSVENEKVLPCVRPKPPIVIPINEAGTGESILILRVQEKLDESVGKHRLVLDLVSQSSTTARDPDLNVCREADRTVVVLDRNPFLVAEVKYLSFDKVSAFGSNVVATWDSNDGIAGAWQLQLEERPFCLVLPPQAVGEEMLKNPDQKINPVKALPFNLGPATTFELNARRARTDLAETPWNLRRILAMQGQTQNGAGVKSMHYELLYGLSADAKNPGIQLADTFSQAGRTMPLPAERIVWAATNDQRAAYRLYREEWGRLYYRLLSRLAVLVPWNELLPLTQQKPIVLSENVSSRLRLPPLSNMKRPVDFFSGDGDPNESDGSLKGGATWGFESKNIYTAVRKNIDATSSRLENFAFSSLGGYGKQEAKFDNNLTKISADVAMGRTFHYQVERLGRIACTFHLAKHVIVYERSVTPSRQFQNPDQPLLGWPVVRKVKEYVQVLEPKRSYPDDELRPGQTRPAESFRKRGFLDSCEFQEGIQIAVDGAWGTDVGDYGWKIPLWRAGAKPEDVYPKPIVHFGLDSNQSEQQKVQRCELKNPDNLYFFTLTKNRKDPNKPVDPDPRKWDPELDIDFVNRPVPKPSTADFVGGDPRAMSPMDPAVPVHYGPCTFQLMPSPVPTDIVSMRAGQPMAAVLETITIVRSIESNVSGAWPPPAVDAVDNLHKYVDTLFRDLLLKNLPLDGNPTAALITSLKARIASTNDFRNRLAAAKSKVTALKADLVARIRTEEDAIARRIKTKLDGFADTAADELDKRVAQYLKDLGAGNVDPEVAKRILLETQHRFEELLLISSSVPGIVPELMARYVELITALRSTIDNELTRIKSALTATAGLQVEEAAAQATALFERAREIVQNVKTIGLTPPLPFLPDPGPVIKEKLETYINGFEDSVKVFLGEIRTAVDRAAAAQAIDRFKAAAYFRALQDLQKLRDFIATATGVTINLGQSPAQIAEAIEKAIHPAHYWQTATLDLWREKVREASGIINTQKSELERARDQLKQFLNAEIKNRTRDLNTLIATRVALAANVVLDALSAAERMLEWEIQGAKGVKDKILEALSAEAGNIKASLENYRDQLFRDAGLYLDQATKLVPTLPTFQEADKALRLIRAFGEPPRVPKLEFERPAVAYFYDEAARYVDLTPAVALVSQAQDLAEKLKPLGVKLPTKQVIDQFLPIDLKEFDFSRIFPSFAGIDFSNFLVGRKLPTLGNDNVRITQGIDAQTRRAFVRADIKFELTGGSTLFAIGPLTVQILDANFVAVTEITTDLQGKTSRKTSGSITADWLLAISNTAIVKFRDTELKFDDNNGIRFSINPRNIELPQIMSFLSEAMTITGEDGSGVTIGLIPGGVQTILSLPFPDIQGATSGISNLHLLAMMALRFDNGFSISVGFGLARKQAPFSLTIFILGGGGFVEAWVTYTPSTKKLACSVEIGITVSASLAIALGPIKGGVYVYFGITALYESGRGLSFGVLYVIRGQVSVLGIVSACVTLMLEARYTPSTKQLVGRGRLSIKIKICWCFTLEVEQEVTYTVGSGNRVAQADSRPRLEAHHAVVTEPYTPAAHAYVTMLA